MVYQEVVLRKSGGRAFILEVSASAITCVIRHHLYSSGAENALKNCGPVVVKHGSEFNSSIKGREYSLLNEADFAIVPLRRKR